MRVAVISDIHGNRHATEAVLDAIAQSDCEQIWCLGDIVDYGGEPDACVELTRAHADICLAGNHDLAVTGAITFEFEDVVGTAMKALEWTQGVVSQETLEFLEGLSSSNVDGVVAMYHASPRDPVWEYVLSPLQAELCFDVQPLRVGLIGHSHVALEFHRHEGETATGAACPANELLDVSEGLWLLNPGSVGQPRDGDPRAAWMELDTAAWTATYRRNNYDIEGAQWAIRAARLPDSLAERLAHGQ